MGAALVVDEVGEPAARVGAEATSLDCNGRVDEGW
jgi:hypothetical protein